MTPADWRLLLDRAATGIPGLVPRKRLRDLALRATDQDWTSGTGADLAGPSEALALALCGRAVALGDLAGDGVAVLRARLS